MSAPRSRLGPDDWLEAGLRAVIESGPGALKAEPLARARGATKGSFYWHFSDVADFHGRLRAHWLEGVSAALAAARMADRTPARKLRHISDAFEVAGTGHDPLALERAMRAWAGTNPATADTVARADEARLAFTSEILAALGLTNPEFPRLVYGAWLGMAALPGTRGDNAGALTTLTAALLALQDA